MVVWVVPPGATGRQMAATFQGVTRRWSRYATPVSVARDGMLRLELVAPSSHAAPVGQIWIDDLALYETKMPSLVSVSEGVGFNDEPTMAAAADGSLYVAWNSFRGSATGSEGAGADSLQVARLRPQDPGFKTLGKWRVLAAKGTYVLGPCAVSAGEEVAVLCAVEKKGNWDVYSVSCGPDGPGRPLRVTSDAAVDVKPAAAWHNGTLWVAWESNRRGSRQVFVASVRDGKVSEPAPVSRPRVSSYGPSLAVLDGGEVCVAWHSFRRNNYDVYLRRRASTGSWNPELRLTHAATIDRHPRLFTRGDELWLVYENAETERYNIGRTNRRRLVVAKITPRGLMAPQGGSPMAGRCEAASAEFDSSGRLWMAFLKPQLPRAGWDAFLTCLADGRWGAPTPLSTQKGMDRRPTLEIVGGRAIVAFQADDIPRSWSDLDRTLEAKSDVFLAGVDLSSAPQAGALPLEPLIESDEPFEPGRLRVLRGEDNPTPTITYQGRTLKLFFGDLHEHTDVSVCNRVGDQSINESYQHMRDIWPRNGRRLSRSTARSTPTVSTGTAT
jgi:hypothetical protein